jgi:THO complex subunit 4
MDASTLPEPAPVKPLSERVAYATSNKPKGYLPLTSTSANPKAQPKSATATKANANSTAKGGRVAGRAVKPKRGRNANRPKAKTTEELDAEMVDYFGANTNGNATGGADGAAVSAQPAGNGEDMDEISVGSVEFIT